MEVPRRPGYSLTVDRIAKSSLARDPTREIVYRVTAGGDRIERYDYSKAFERVNALANALSALGVRRGDRIATLDWNTHCCPPPASLGGYTPPPSGLSDLRSDAHSSSLLSDSPCLGHHLFSWGRAPCLGGRGPPGTGIQTARGRP